MSHLVISQNWQKRSIKAIPMKNYGQCAIVIGYHPFTYPPELAHKAGLGNRFAVIFDTTNQERGYAYLDPILYAAVLSALCEAVPLDSLVIKRSKGGDLHAFEDLLEELSPCDVDLDPPERVLGFRHTKLVAFAETEEWINIGGPAPYSDSYTLSVYTELDRSDDFLQICRRVLSDHGISITDIHVGQKVKIPFRPWWKAGLDWLGFGRAVQNRFENK